jgi:AcrR family transcriptional regulator
MDAEERREKMKSAVMHVVAEKGLDSFSVAQAAEHADINEALVYRDFGTRENLLNECYRDVNKEILRQYGNETSHTYHNNADVQEQMYRHWLVFFQCLVRMGFKTLFFQQYRDSSLCRNEMAKNPVDCKDDAKETFIAVYSKFAKSQNNAEFVAAFIIDGSVLFAKRIISGEMPDTKETYNIIWHMLNGGLKEMSHIKIAE